ncbi:MAG: bifunctional oligoribonuclease/PAP phosphatase NrnA, partial [Clostridia bacterium]|nr:bifunctional oligoribonuclease/PAP phosphatase NrnA [Clostridia bacterium]
RAFLPGIEELKLPDDAFGYDSVITVDCADLVRTGSAEKIANQAKYTLNIDHHKTNDMYAQINCVDGEAAAVGELIFKLAQSLGFVFDVDTAVCVYTAIMTDTGNFSYSNTSAFTFEAASKLKAVGIDSCNINRMVYRSVPYNKLKLTGLAINKMQLALDGRFGYCALTRAEMASVGAADVSVEGIIDNIRDVETVEFAAFIHEKEEKTFRVSLRSKNVVDVGKVAARMGGGGHARAAGYTAYGEVKQVEAQLLEMAENELNG